MDDDLPLSILKQLIQIASQNPMGRRPTGEGWCEKGLSEWLCRFFTRHSVPHRYDEIEPDRGNVIAWLDGNPDRPTVLLDAHQDTVPAEGMTIDPFRPVEREGRLYGRGACDVKGAMASILAAAIRLTKVASKDRSSVIISMTCDEELNQIGAHDLVQHLGDSASPFPGKPDVAIISEPTELDVVIAHKGVARWKIRTEGVAVHSSKPERGKNAIYAMATIIGELEQLAHRLRADELAHPLCGSPSISVGTVSGGQSVNIVPDACEIEVDRRVIPGESIESVLKQTKDYLQRSSKVPFEMLPPYTVCPPLNDEANAALAERLVEVASGVAGGSKTIGVPYATHAPQFARAGIPTVVFGPGSIDQAHTKDEWISIDQLDQSTEILFRFVTQSDPPILGE